MKYLPILTLLIPTVVIADINNISWTPPTEWTDGTPIEKLEHYNLYCESLPEPIKIIDGEAYKVEELAVGKHDCYLTAIAKYSDSMQESAPSNIVQVEMYPSPKTTIITISAEITIKIEKVL